MEIGVWLKCVELRVLRPASRSGRRGTPTSRRGAGPTPLKVVPAAQSWSRKQHPASWLSTVPQADHLRSSRFGGGSSAAQSVVMVYSHSCGPRLLNACSLTGRNSRGCVRATETTSPPPCGSSLIHLEPWIGSSRRPRGRPARLDGCRSGHAVSPGPKAQRRAASRPACGYDGGNTATLPGSSWSAWRCDVVMLESPRSRQRPTQHLPLAWRNGTDR
jgi:hypothetical protein